MQPMFFRDVQPVRERKQPDPKSGRRRSVFNALTHSPRGLACWVSLIPAHCFVYFVPAILELAIEEVCA